LATGIFSGGGIAIADCGLRIEFEETASRIANCGLNLQKGFETANETPIRNPQFAIRNF